FSGGQGYTPQLVVDGVSEMVGSDRGAVMAALRAAKPEAIAPVSFATDRRSVAIGIGEGQGEIVLLRFAQHRATQIAAGENAGRAADDSNGVLEQTTLGRWTGAAQHFAI